MPCFYDKGLGFECQGCGHCCADEPGYVFLSKQDLDNLTKETGTTLDEFINTYCRKVDMGPFYMVTLLEKENYDCIFLSDRGCKVYNARPVQCRTYPFWEDLVESKENWDREAIQCPGMNKGQLHTKKEIEQKVRQRVANSPYLIPKA